MFNLGSSYFHVALTTVRHLLNVKHNIYNLLMHKHSPQNDIIPFTIITRKKDTQRSESTGSTNRKCTQISQQNTHRYRSTRHKIQKTLKNIRNSQNLTDQQIQCNCYSYEQSLYCKLLHVLTNHCHIICPV